MRENLELIYENRFAGMQERRQQIWSVLIRHFFQRWVRPTDTVLDLGPGYCEFINNVTAAKKYALDLNPAFRSRAGHDVNAIVHDLATPWPLQEASVDVVFSSNLLEHLPTKDAVQFCLKECRRVLRNGGRLLLLGPNIRVCPDTYWDFFDHYVPLSDRSLVEALQSTGFTTGKVVSRFLPMTMTGSLPSHPLLVRLYLAFPVVWSLLGKQFFIEACKS